MILDLNDPDSIIRWWQIAPYRHGLHLAGTAKRWPQFAWPIRVAMRRINADPAWGCTFRECIAQAQAQRDLEAHLAASQEHEGTPAPSDVANSERLAA